MNETINTKLGNKSFAVKKAILAGEGAGFGIGIGGVLEQDEWTAESIAARTRHLAEVAYDKIWKVPV